MSSPASTFAARRGRCIALFSATGALLAATALLSVTVGQYQLSPSELWPILTAGPLAAADLDASVVWQIRLPRLVLGLLVGAALGVGGALMQAVFANPLAEPSVIGVSSGAGVGAAAALVFDITAFGTMTVPVFAFAAGIFTTAVVYRLSRVDGQARVLNLILVGIAANAIAGACISTLTFLAPTSAREQITFWQMGSLAGASWAHTGAVAAVVAAAIALAMPLARKLDILALGDQAAFHVGINVHRLRLAAIAVSTLLTAAAVSFAGLIGFVGLVIPHIVRTVAGPANTTLIPASALGGALLVAAGDVFARTAIDFADLPVGIFTAFIGGPTFFILLRQMLRKNHQL
ncbi:FecCD family ABC transporter permease [Corynebacterium bouchesdurhonense]|uniref:FecCD family ABC transporter permease n=1 Tax=Corynebacterium bouchesdurhonense TaxID=1720192 RepID=UPI00082F919D|nr:iron ABC transporter permease [Corynebacterium bouchesdurhonense]